MSSTSLAFAHAGGPPPRRRRVTADATATSIAADAAIRHIRDRRRARHKYGEHQPPKRSPLGRAVGDITDSIGESIRQIGVPQWAFRAGVVLAVAAVLGWAVLFRGGVKLHSVDGVLLVNGRPLPQATLRFMLPGQSPDDARVFQTDQAGGFRTEADASLRQGLYTVVVQPSNQAVVRNGSKQPVIPAMYADAATSPLRVEVSEDLTGLKLLVRR
jgi:hypothetical protein